MRYINAKRRIIFSELRLCIWVLTCLRNFKKLLFISNWSWQNSDNGHMADFKVRPHSISNGGADLLELVPSRLLNYVLYLCFFTVQLIQRILWTCIGLLGKVHRPGAILMMNSLSSRHSERVSIIIYVLVGFFKHW